MIQGLLPAQILSICMYAEACAFGLKLNVSPSRGQGHDILQGLPEKIIAPIVYPILKALAYLHKHDIAHRDVKVYCILSNWQGNCLMLPFAYAKYLKCTNLHDTKQDLVANAPYLRSLGYIYIYMVYPACLLSIPYLSIGTLDAVRDLLLSPTLHT